MKQQLFGEFCDQLIKLHSSVRFVGIADDTGSLISISERKGLKPLLNHKETEQYAITAATRQYTRLRWQYSLGKVDYTCSVYEKLIRANIPITDSKNRLAFVILLTFDIGTDNFHQLMTKKIIPLIRKNKVMFLKEAERNQ
ncbi:MAG TPA: hypothetical protein VJ729_03475 [Nitrososphaeraceae archaeon]|nr:hypothetical protein [Nitrososphaeraceae archaeon]